MNDEELKKQNDKILRDAEIKKLKPISFDEMSAVFHKWLIIEDEGILKFLTCFYFANKRPEKAVWGMIVGPSGGGKTEFLNAFTDLPDIVPVSMITPTTFLSGMPGTKDASLLPELNGKIMLMKDFTTIISMQRDARSEIFSQFREIWDGEMKKIFGNGKVRHWQGKVSLLAASTQAVDLLQQQTTHLGERFVYYRPIMPNRKEVARKSLENNTQHDQMILELKNAVCAFFNGFTKEDFEAENLPQLPPALKDELVNLADFSTMARSGVIRDFGLKKDVVFVPAAEMPSRFSQQLASLACGCMSANKGPVNEMDKRMLYKCALDSIPQTNKMVIIEMAKADKQTTAQIATALGYPTEPIKMYLENLALLGVCKRLKEGRADTWILRPDFSKIICQYEGIKKLTEEEIKQREKDVDSGSSYDQEFLLTEEKEDFSTVVQPVADDF